MPIPSFTIDGVLPPYVGPCGPGGVADKRKAILRGWLQHRAALRDVGFGRGFQWLDGSFVEGKDPRDLDIVTFLYRPPGFDSASALGGLLGANLDLFDRAQVKATYSLDAFPVDLNGSPEGVVNAARYFLSLFSHRRGDDLWKGMLQVRLENTAADIAALEELDQKPDAFRASGGTNP
jgi:hypothetical protein